MSNKEKCLRILDGFTEDQLKDIAIMLKSAKTMTDEAADDAFLSKALYGLL